MLSKKVARLEERCESLENYAQDLLATVRVNVDRGLLVGRDAEAQKGLSEVIQRFEKRWRELLDLPDPDDPMLIYKATAE